MLSSALSLLATNEATAASASNAQSPIGLNLNGVRYYSPEQPFLDMFKMTGASPTTPMACTVAR